MFVGEGLTLSADKKIIKICNDLRNDVENMLNTEFNEYTPLTYRREVVAGYNFFVRIQVGEKTYINIIIFIGLGGQSPKLTSSS